MNPEVLQAAEVPHDVGIGDKTTHEAAGGVKVKIHTLKLAGFLKLLTAVKAVGMKDLPSAVSPLDFLTNEQRAELAAIVEPKERTQRAIEFLSSLTGEQKFFLKESDRLYKQAIFDWVCESDKLLPAALSACTNLKSEEIDSLDLPDALEVLNKAIDLQNWPVLVEAASRFFGRIGGLLKTAGRQSGTGKAGREEAAR